jgi:FAD/FMN-containing dehydrogenase
MISLVRCSSSLVRVLHQSQWRVASASAATSASLKRTRSQRSLSTLRAPTSQDIERFRSILEDTPGSLLQESEEDVSAYTIDWTKHYNCRSDSDDSNSNSISNNLVLRPATVDQISEILAYCHAERLAVVPQAGNTGLVGGSIPTVSTEIVLSVNKLKTIDSLEKTTGILKCQAGCLLQDLQTYCADRQHLVPVDLGSKGSCMIGGNVSTNAGGQYFYRYGSLAGNVLGLQVVTATGQILDLNYSHPHLKDNTGYKLHQLFVGAEGTLGIVTGVVLQCPRLPASRQAAFLACESYAQVLQVLDAAKTILGETLAALEFMDRTVVGLVAKNHTIPVVKDDNDDDDTGGLYAYYILVETHGSNAEHDQSKMEDFLEDVMAQEYVVNGVLAQDLSQLESFWKIRETTNAAVAATGYTYKYDISLAIPEFAEWDQEMTELLEGLPVVQANWGHILDGNLHFNVATPGKFEKDDAVLQRLEPALFEAVIRRGGSISAEHGLGQSKNQYLDRIHDPAKLETMLSIRQLFDPHGILNPHKYLPDET